MRKMTIIPAQIRAARALLNLTQEQLATSAEVALTSVRDLEAEKRAVDSAVAGNVRRALENGGVEFVAGTPTSGPGVRLAANRPNVIRRPSVMMMWEGMPVEIEFKGKHFTAFISREVIEDLGRLKGTEPADAYLNVFDKHQGTLLDAIRAAFDREDRWDKQGRLYVKSDQIPELAG